jgi:hypothetical protein
VLIARPDGAWRTFDAGEPGTTIIDATAAPSRSGLATRVLLARASNGDSSVEHWDLAQGARLAMSSALGGAATAWEHVPDVEPDGWRNAMLRMTLAEPESGAPTIAWSWFAVADGMLDDPAIAYPWDDGRWDAICFADADADGDVDCLLRDSSGGGWTLFRNARVDR